MKVNILFFAVFRERIGNDTVELELGDSATASDAIAALESDYEVVRDLRGRYRIAINREMADLETKLAEGDELALIPPVAGGDDPPRHVRITSDPLSLDRVVTAVAGPSAGGIATFIGAVRNRNRGQAIERLEYEAYEEMATEVIDGIAATIEGEIPGTRLAVEHRIGTLAIGDLAVVIACAAPHRDEAFRGCRAMIDRLKEHAPIWKKEFGSDGETWIGLGP